MANTLIKSFKDKVFEHPFGESVVNEISKYPALWKVYDNSSHSLNVAPFPRFHMQFVVLEVVFVKLTVKGEQPSVKSTSKVTFGIGSTFTMALA